MSHFTVLVIGDDIEKQLQPFHEYECTGEDDEYVVYVDIMEEALEEFKSGTTVRYKNAAGELVESDDSFYRDPTPEELKEHGPLGGTGWGGGKRWTSQDWGDGQGYRTKMFEIPEGFEEVRVAYDQVITLHEFTADWWGLDIIVGDTPLIGKNEGYVRVVDGVMTEAFKYTNPNAKWDWWSLGGRWSNMLRLKPVQLLPSTEMFDQFGFSQAEFMNFVDLYQQDHTAFMALVLKYKGLHHEITDAVKTYLTPIYPNSYTGSPGVMGAQHSPDGPGRCDQCRIGDLDIALMEKESIDAALEEFNRFNTEVLAKCNDKAMKSWEAVRKMFHDKIDQARAYYNSQEMMVKAREAKFNFWGDDPTERFFVGELKRKEKVIEKARCAAFSTFAVLKDGEWYEKGEMGWWGMVSDEKLEYDWDAKFSELIHDLPDDTLLSIVDCHI